MFFNNLPHSTVFFNAQIKSLFTDQTAATAFIVKFGEIIGREEEPLR